MCVNKGLSSLWDFVWIWCWLFQVLCYQYVQIFCCLQKKQVGRRIRTKTLTLDVQHCFGGYSGKLTFFFSTDLFIFYMLVVLYLQFALNSKINKPGGIKKEHDNMGKHPDWAQISIIWGWRPYHTSDPTLGRKPPKSTATGHQRPPSLCVQQRHKRLFFHQLGLCWWSWLCRRYPFTCPI